MGWTYYGGCIKQINETVEKENKIMFWMWNNAREIININQITCIEVVEKDDNYDEMSDEEKATEDEEREKYFADVYLTDRTQPFEVSREQFQSLISTIKQSYMYHSAEPVKGGENNAK